MLLIGIGNPDRGDDGVGQWVGARLAERLPDLPIQTGGGDAADLLDWWRDVERVLVIDAVRTSQPPGTVLRIEAHDEELPAEHFRGSTHAMGLAEAVELARAMDELPARLTVIGIVGEQFDPGAGLSRPVREAAQRLVEDLTQELQPEDERHA